MRDSTWACRCCRAEWLVGGHRFRSVYEYCGHLGPLVISCLTNACGEREQFVFGDIANRDVLESAGVHTAEAVILTIPDDEAVLRACRVIREINPTIFIAARTSYLSRAIAATAVNTTPC